MKLSVAYVGSPFPELPETQAPVSERRVIAAPRVMWLRKPAREIYPLAIEAVS